MRQAGYAAVSQPGARLLGPAFAKAFAGLEVVVFYDAGEEHEAHKDALKLLEAGARSLRVAEWEKDAPHGSDVNEKLVEDSEGFEKWLAEMVAATNPPASVATDAAGREGKPEAYVASVPEPPPWPELVQEALCYPDWIALHHPSSGEWVEVRAEDCFPSLVEEANRGRKKR